MILVFPMAAAIRTDPSAFLDWARLLIGYLATVEIGCVPRVALEIAIGLLAGSAVNWQRDRQLSTGEWDQIGPASSVELISDATLRPS